MDYGRGGIGPKIPGTLGAAGTPEVTDAIGSGPAKVRNAVGVGIRDDKGHLRIRINDDNAPGDIDAGRTLQGVSISQSHMVSG